MARPNTPAARVARVLSHPLRPRILQAVALRGESSPTEIAASLQEPLGSVSYHVRILRDEGWLELVRTAPRRGAVEHFYRAVARPYLSDFDWERLPVGIRRRLADETVGHVLRAASGAAGRGAFDAPGAHIDRMPLQLDDEGWAELSAALTQVLDEAARIQERSSARQRGAARASGRPSQLAILHFELDAELEV